MYKLSKCFNTTLKFLNKSRISKTLIGVKVKIDDENEGNKIFNNTSQSLARFARPSPSSKLLLKSQSNFLPDYN